MLTVLKCQFSGVKYLHNDEHHLCHLSPELSYPKRKLRIALFYELLLLFHGSRQIDCQSVRGEQSVYRPSTCPMCPSTQDAFGDCSPHLHGALSGSQQPLLFGGPPPC